MAEKRPEFTGPLVNSWPGRLLTLEIARFSVISWDVLGFFPFFILVFLFFSCFLFVFLSYYGNKNESKT